MRIDNAFPSNYLKAADLQGRNITVTMSHVKMEDIGGDHKPILYFLGKEKGMVLNKTNSNNITQIYGPETDDWQGQVIELFPAMVDFQGKTVEAIRVRGTRKGGNGAARPQARPAQHPHAPPVYDDSPPSTATRSTDQELDDDIPF